MTDLSLFTSLPVRKIVKGDTLSVYMTVDGALFQGINPDTGTVTPTWNDTDGPKITPNVGSARGLSYTLESHKWYYNNGEIEFPTGSGWVTSTDGKFKLNKADGTLQIVKDLASLTNQDVDTLKYSGVARQNEQVVYTVEKTVDVFISPLGSSSFGGSVQIESAVLGTLDSGTVISSTCVKEVKLYNGEGEVSNFTVSIRKGLDGTYLVQKVAAGSVSNTKITRDMVDGQQVFIVEFYIPSSTTAVYRTGFTVQDKDDLYQPHAYMEGNPSDTGDKGIIKGYVYKVKTNEQATVSSGTVTLKLVDSSNLSTIETFNVAYTTFRDTGITITKDHLTDSEGNDITATANIQMDVVI